MSNPHKKSRISQKVPRRRMPKKKVEVVRGRVKWFDPDKGYGFITRCNNGVDIFMNHRDVWAHQFLIKDDLVLFSVSVDQSNRPKAINVRLESTSHTPLQFEGSCSFFHPALHYGFISVYGTPHEIFFHQQDLEEERLRHAPTPIAVGTYVCFEVDFSDRDRPRAARVEILPNRTDYSSDEYVINFQRSSADECSEISSDSSSRRSSICSHLSSDHSHHNGNTNANGVDSHDNGIGSEAPKQPLMDSTSARDTKPDSSSVCSKLHIPSSPTKLLLLSSDKTDPPPVAIVTTNSRASSTTPNVTSSSSSTYPVLLGADVLTKQLQNFQKTEHELREKIFWVQRDIRKFERQLQVPALEPDDRELLNARIQQLHIQEREFPVELNKTMEQKKAAVTALSLTTSESPP